ncbi:PAS domain S-box protein, partial [bacterium]|nr:PAS domain S-box protein [bacterium]
QERWIADASVEIRNAEGVSIGSVGILIDITERKLAENELKLKTDQIISSQKEIESLYAKSENARKSLLSILQDVTGKEQALRKSEGRFRDVASNTGDWIWELDKEGRYTYNSPVVQKVIGYEDKEVLGKYFYDFFHPDERDELKKAAFEVFKQKEVFKDFINRNVHKDGHVVILETSGVPLLDESGNLLGYRGVDRDITKRKQAEEELQERLQELEIYYKATMGREGRIIELKQQVNELLAQLGKAKKYDV